MPGTPNGEPGAAIAAPGSEDPGGTAGQVCPLVAYGPAAAQELIAPFSVELITPAVSR